MISLATNKEFKVHKCAERDNLVVFVLASFYNPSPNFCKLMFHEIDYQYVFYV